jgi:hypothetical protein
MAAAKAMPLSSHGMAAMKWSPRLAMVGPKYGPTARSKAKSRSKPATISPLSPADPRLLQQPAKALRVQKDRQQFRE